MTDAAKLSNVSLSERAHRIGRHALRMVEVQAKGISRKRWALPTCWRSAVFMR